MSDILDEIIPDSPIEAAQELQTIKNFELDPMDLPAAILYLAFDIIMAVAPTVFFYTFIQPIASNWSGNYNRMFLASWRSVYIGNLVFYGLPALVGGFAWLWNIYIVGGYIAWSQYLVVWGGTLMQMVNLILLIAGASTYDEASSAGGNDTQIMAWTAFGVETGIVAGIYVGYWLLNDNFLAYWVVEEIINGLANLGVTKEEVLQLF